MSMQQKITGQKLKDMTSMEFTQVISILPLGIQLELAISKIGFSMEDFNEVAEILNKLKEIE